MTERAELQTQIETTIRETEKNHEKAKKTLASLKKKMNDLELRMFHESFAVTDAETEKLNSVVDKLDRFIDSLILDSAKARKKYEKLNHECNMRAFDPVSLRNLETLCQENEQLAKDLLCYSLGHFKSAHNTSRRRRR